MTNKIKKDLFLKVKREVIAKPKQQLLLRHLADVVADDDIQQQIEEIKVKKVNKDTGQSMIITALEIIQAIKRKFPEAKINHLGEADVVIDIKENIKNENSSSQPKLYIVLVGILLFLGSGMAIMNFHADVDMSKVHQQIYQLIMGEKKRNPLLLQIPYSIGVACGMFIFFNNFFNYKLDDDPNPLDVEMYLYEDKVNRFSLHQKAQKAKKEKED
ncbi:stage V sporulation protein AA [Halobacteroides halobius]|uniref:stage V sporulation protein AA n=1 Tax=Halobacteroides halobius TaxID=42422 RepID=UPI000313AA7D|nr:stage V sporulation protein AA [Halobacteroides halobius]